MPARTAAIEPADIAESTASVAVLPVQTSGIDADRALGDALFEDLTTTLAGVVGLRVQSATVVSLQVAKEPDQATLGNRLGARFLIEGRLVRVLDGIRIHVRIFESTSGATCWAHRHLSSDACLFADLSSIVGRVIDGAGRSDGHPSQG